MMSKKGKIKFAISIISIFTMIFLMVLTDLNILEKGNKFTLIALSILTVIGAITIYQYMKELDDYNSKHKPPKY